MSSLGNPHLPRGQWCMCQYYLLYCLAFPPWRLKAWSLSMLWRAPPHLPPAMMSSQLDAIYWDASFLIAPLGCLCGKTRVPLCTSLFLSFCPDHIASISGTQPCYLIEPALPPWPPWLVVILYVFMWSLDASLLFTSKPAEISVGSVVIKHHLGKGTSDPWTWYICFCAFRSPFFPLSVL